MPTDVAVVLKEHLDRITPSRIIGAPDLVIEVSSPGTVGYDRRNKQDAYAQAGVPEYWIADPATCTVEVLVLEGKEYRFLGVFVGEEGLPAHTLPELPVPVKKFFG